VATPVATKPAAALGIHQNANICTVDCGDTP